MLDRSQFSLYYMEGTASYNYFSQATPDTNAVAAEIFRQYRMNNESGNYTNQYILWKSNALIELGSFLNDILLTNVHYIIHMQIQIQEHSI